jgi:hypothetical protein
VTASVAMFRTIGGTVGTAEVGRMKPNEEYWGFRPGDLIQHVTMGYMVLLWWERIPGPYEDIRIKVWNLRQNTVSYEGVSSFKRPRWSHVITPG